MEASAAEVLQGRTSLVGDYEDFNCNFIRRQISPEWRGKKKKKEEKSF